MFLQSLLSQANQSTLNCEETELVASSPSMWRPTHTRYYTTQASPEEQRQIFAFYRDPYGEEVRANGRDEQPIPGNPAWRYNAASARVPQTFMIPSNWPPSPTHMLVSPIKYTFARMVPNHWLPGVVREHDDKSDKHSGGHSADRNDRAPPSTPLRRPTMSITSPTVRSSIKVVKRAIVDTNIESNQGGQDVHCQEGQGDPSSSSGIQSKRARTSDWFGTGIGIVQLVPGFPFCCCIC